MSSEALERAQAALLRLHGTAFSEDGKSCPACAVEDVLRELAAEVARLEQERDDLEGELADFGESRPGRLARAEAALAVARERDARQKALLRRWLRGHSLADLRPDGSGTNLEAEVRAALVDEPAAADLDIRGAVHLGVAWVTTPEPASAAADEPGETP